MKSAPDTVGGKASLHESEWEFSSLSGKREIEGAYRWEYGRELIRCDAAHAAVMACIRWKLKNKSARLFDAPFADSYAAVAELCPPFALAAELKFANDIQGLLKQPPCKAGASLRGAANDSINEVLPWQAGSNWRDAWADLNPLSSLPNDEKPAKSSKRNFALAELSGDRLEWETGWRSWDELRKKNPAMIPTGTLEAFITDYEMLRDAFANHRDQIQYGCFAINWDGPQKEIVKAFSKWVKERMAERKKTWKTKPRPAASHRRELNELGALRCKRYYGRSPLVKWLNQGGESAGKRRLKSITPVANVNTLDEYATAADERITELRSALIPLWQLIASSRR